MKTIFLSYSSKDEALAQKLYDVLMLFINQNKLSNDYNVFFAKQSIKSEKGTQDWKSKIKAAISNCSSFVVILTPNSIQNRWVNYETGLASAKNGEINIVPVGVMGIDFNMVIENTIQMTYLHEFEDINIIMSQVFDQNEQVLSWTNNPISMNAIRKLIYQANIKTVYFVGSNPIHEKGILWENEDDAKRFVDSFCEKLLSHDDFRLASYPEVPTIGQTVASCAIRYNKGDYYKVAGLYRFDQQTKESLEELGINSSAWDKMMQRIRKAYLKEMDSIIIIGGGANTQKECDVARLIPKIQLFPIPCFGGYGEILYNEMCKGEDFRAFEHPCHLCSKHKRERGECPRLNDFINRLGKFRKQIP